MRPYILAASLLAIAACSEGQKDQDAPVAENSAPLAPGTTPTPYKVMDLTLDATQKSVWVHYGLREGELVPMTKDQPWIIGVSRYMWQTNTGSSGPYAGGAYEEKEKSFEDTTQCDKSRFVKDIMVPPLGSVHEIITSNWWNIADPVPTPLDTHFVIGRENECIKLKLLTYDKGLYTLKFQRIP